MLIAHLLGGLLHASTCAQDEQLDRCSIVLEDVCASKEREGKLLEVLIVYHGDHYRLVESELVGNIEWRRHRRQMIPHPFPNHYYKNQQRS
jgi:hypothetical protein